MSGPYTEVRGGGRVPAQDVAKLSDKLLDAARHVALGVRLTATPNDLQQLTLSIALQGLLMSGLSKELTTPALFDAIGTGLGNFTKDLGPRGRDAFERRVCEALRAIWSYHDAVAEAGTAVKS
jgi:hypothetical protein